MTESENLRDVPSMKKLREEIGSFQVVARLTPLIRLLGRPGRKIAEQLGRIPELASQAERLSNLPDRFNDTFAERGWIAYEMMKMDVMEEAVKLADEGRLDDAENLIADYYDEENIRFKFMFMSGIPEFSERMPLLEKALSDYLAGRYHACVPVVLALTDGFVDDVGKANAGFFSKSAKLTAWDSISAHDKGLQKLAAILGKPRKRTRTEQISVPYRNGILHGHDLGYDNKLVAAKCWAALFSLRDWALAQRDGRGPRPEKQEGILDAFRKLLEVEKRKELITSWRPRPEDELLSVPRSGVPDDYREGTPERCVVEFLDAWKRKNYGRMARALRGCADGDIGRRAGELRQDARERTLEEFAVLRVSDSAAAIAVVDVELTVREDEEVRTVGKSARLLFENEAEEPRVFGAEDGTWKLVNLDLIW